MKRINETKRNRILSIISVCILLICSVIIVGISSQATDEIIVTAEITEKNLDYRAMVHMAFAIELHDDAPEGTPGIAIWNDGMKSYNPDNAIYTSFDKRTSEEGKEFYLGMPIAITDLSKSYRVAVVIQTSNGIVVSSNPELYSVTDYANERLSDLAAVYEDNGALTEKQLNQKNLYEKLLVLAGLPNNAFDELKPYVYTEASILPLKGGANGAVAIVHDDGDITTMQLLDKMLVDNGLVADVALILDKVYDKNNTSVKTDSLNAFKEYINNGRWSIINHSGTHSWWGSKDGNGNAVINEDLLNYEVVTSQEKLRELFPGQDVLTFAYPGFSSWESQFDAISNVENLKKYIYSPEARELIMKHHIAARCSRGDTAVVTNKNINWDWVFGYFLTPDRVTNWLDGVINGAISGNQILVASIHALTEDEDVANTPGGYYLHNTYMETACEKIAAQVANGKLWNAHYEDIALYVREAQDAFVEAIYDDANEKITVSLSDSLDDSIYNYELTVRVKIPDNWKAVTVNYNGKNTIATAKIVDGNNVVDIEVAPDNGSAVITPEIKDEDSILASDFGVTLANGTKIDTNYFPGFVRKSVTFSMDDGIVANDSAFIDIVRRGGILGTFNLINTASNRNGLTDEQYKALYAGYEVANHHLYHPLPWFDFDGFDAEDFADIPIHETIIYSDSIKNTLDSQYIYKTDVEGLYYIDYNYHFAKDYSSKYWHPIMTNNAYAKYAEETKKDIEDLFGEGSVVGFAYPHGKTNDAVKAYLESAGYLYARRTVGRADNVAFPLPMDRYDWSYNANHTTLNDVMADYAAYGDDGDLKFFCFGVHAVDYKNAGWDELEKFVDTYGNRADEYYYASIKDILHYEDAVNALMIKDGMLLNASDIALYITINNVKTIIPANSVCSISDGSISEYKSNDYTGWTLLQ